MKMKVIVPVVGIILLLTGVGVFALTRRNANEEAPPIMETPPSVSVVNALPLAQRPYVEIIPNVTANAGRCTGVDLIVKNLKNGEASMEYELEYNTDKLIQGVFGRRDFTDVEAKHQPLEFGTCSSGACKCHTDINSGSLKLSMEGDQSYILKGDFSWQNVGDNEGLVTSRDNRLELESGTALGTDAVVIITSTMGLPAPLTEKVLVGPYGIFVQGAPKLKSPVKATLRSKDVVGGKVQIYDGEAWKVLDAQIEGEAAVFEIDTLGVIVLTGN